MPVSYQKVREALAELFRLSTHRENCQSHTSEDLPCNCAVDEAYQTIEEAITELIPKCPECSGKIELEEIVAPPTASIKRYSLYVCDKCGYQWDLQGVPISVGDHQFLQKELLECFAETELKLEKTLLRRSHA